MALKFEEVQTPYPARSLDDFIHKGRLFEVLRLTSKPEFQWFKPLACLTITGEPNLLLSGLAQVHKIGGSKLLEGLLRGKAFSLLSKYVLSLEKGGHPIDGRAALLFLRLASGGFYEDVLDDEKKLELLTLDAGGDKKAAIERAKARVKRAKKRITDLGLHVRHIDPTIKKFRQQISLAAKKLESR